MEASLIIHPLTAKDIPLVLPFLDEKPDEQQALREAAKLDLLDHYYVVWKAERDHTRRRPLCVARVARSDDDLSQLSHIAFKACDPTLSVSNKLGLRIFLSLAFRRNSYL